MDQVETLDLQDSQFDHQMPTSPLAPTEIETDIYGDDDDEEMSEEESKTSDEEVELVKLHSTNFIEIDDADDDDCSQQHSLQKANGQDSEDAAPGGCAKPPPGVGTESQAEGEEAKKVEEIIDSDQEAGQDPTRGAFKEGFSTFFCKLITFE